ncbi:MAG: carboxypeptidase-like regulatory domain-containing protein, partial [Terracidiphilus sp.]
MAFAQSADGVSGTEQSARPAPAKSGGLQPAPYGTLIGKLTDLYSKPLGGVTVIARNQGTGFEARSTTRRNGAYRFEKLPPGEYTVEAESPQLGRGQVEDIVIIAGHDARVQTAIQFSPLTSTPVLATAPSPSQPQWNRAGAPRPALAAAPVATGGTAWATEPLARLNLRGQPIPMAAAAKANPAVASGPAGRFAAAAQGQKIPAPSQSPVSIAPPASASRAVRTSMQTSASLPVESPAPGAAPASGGPAAPPRRMPQPAGAVAGVKPIQGAAHPIEMGKAAVQPAVEKPAQPTAHPVLAASRQNSPAAQATTSTMSARQLEALPVSGRHWQDFVLNNAPTSVISAGGQGRISLRGGEPQPVTT